MGPDYCEKTNAAKGLTFAEEAHGRVSGIRGGIDGAIKRLSGLADNAFGSRPEATENSGRGPELRVANAGNLGAIIGELAEMEQQVTMLHRVIDRMEQVA